MAFYPKRITWHHSADASPGQQLGKINASHKGRGFPFSSLGYFVGYHYLVEKDGSVVQTRKDNEIGAHTLNQNADNLGICMAGNFVTELPTDAQLAAFLRLAESLLVNYKLHFRDMHPHRFYKATACPGSLLPDDWPQVQLLAQKQRDVQGIMQAFTLLL